MYLNPKAKKSYCADYWYLDIGGFLFSCFFPLCIDLEIQPVAHSLIESDNAHS